MVNIPVSATIRALAAGTDRKREERFSNQPESQKDRKKVEKMWVETHAAAPYKGLKKNYAFLTPRTLHGTA